MKAQTVKNAVIVPVGAKGGFVLRNPPAEREALREEVRLRYSTLIRGMLDVTDNIVGGEVVRPAGVRAFDEDDPYLVVAADKGTAALSDTANAIAIEYGFWLGDAFASGGSKGYDHKALGITARGAWESVKRHFRELGRDVDARAVHGRRHRRHVGRRVRQRHAAVAPDPARRRVRSPPRVPRPDARRRGVASPSASASSRSAPARRGRTTTAHAISRRRRRLVAHREVGAALARGARRARASSRGARSRRAACARSCARRSTCSGTAASARSSRPPTRRTPRSATATPTPCASTAAICAARVVGEGGNLGLTQRGRIEYAAAGGRINTDAIDNSAGVDCSDHEVNIKILLGAARRGRAADAERARRAAGRGRRRGLRPRALRQLPAGADPQPGAGDRAAARRGARDADARARAARACSTASSRRCPRATSSPSAGARAAG